MRTAQYFHAIQLDELALQKTRVRYLPNPVDVSPYIRDAAHIETTVGYASASSIKEHVRHNRGQILGVFYVLHCQGFFADGSYRHWRILQAGYAPCRRDDNFFEAGARGFLSDRELRGTRSVRTNGCDHSHVNS